MRRLTLQIFIGLLVLLHQVSSAASLQQIVVGAGNAFAIDLYSRASTHAGDFCISPYSVYSALGMTAAGAGGKTQTQMLSVMHWDGSLFDLTAAAAALNLSLLHSQAVPPSTSPQITIANALFGQAGYPYRQGFLDLLSNEYGAALQSADFAAQPQQACDQINRWAAEKTHDRIKQAVPRSALSGQTRLVLVDAIYFKANWELAFTEKATHDQPFFKRGQTAIHVPTMEQKKTFGYMESDSLQMAEFPYNGDFSLIVLLPRKNDGLASLENSLTTEEFAARLTQLSPQLLQVYLPLFRLDGDFDLTDYLQKMGMTDAFDPKSADFSGMVSSGNLNIDRVIHKTFISVDEAGTEAAAVTSVTMRATAMMPTRHDPQPIIFRVDHPFVFVLRQRSTGAILFIGRIGDPRQS